MDKFIYVFKTSDRDKLLSDGFKLLQSDTINNIYIFLNEPLKVFELNDMRYCTNNVIAF